MASVATPEAPAPDAEAGLDRERLDFLVRYSTTLRWPMVATALVIAAIGWTGGIHPGAVAAWLVATLLVRELRAAALQRMRIDRRGDVERRLRPIALWTFALGAAYGASTAFMPAMATVYGAILTMVLMSLSAGAVSTTFTVPTAFTAFAAAIAAPAALAWLASGSALGWSVGALILMFLGVQSRYARQNLKMFEDSYRIRLANAELLQRLSDEQGKLERARDAAVEADRSKSRFLAAASHDLRQPLQSLALNSDALARMPIPRESRVIVDEIASGIESLRRMLDTLLDISQLDAGAVSADRRAIPVDRLLEAVCLRFRPAAQAKGLALTARCAAVPEVFSDVQMLQRVLSNLIDNALKFTDTGGITLQCAAVGTRVRISVSDTGRGIAPADQQIVFQDLIQLDNPHRDHAVGHGLGLGIVRRLCTLLDIGIELHSRPGEGTRFDLSVPCAVTPPVLAQAAEAPAPSVTARQALVLDDDASVRHAYERALGALGCRAHTAATLDDALAIADRERPQVALVDYRLAHAIDGFEAVARLRERCPGLAAILVTADTSAPLRERAARMALPMLRKPVTGAMLASAINEALTNTNHAS